MRGWENSQSNYRHREEFWNGSGSRVRASVEWNGGRKGENELSILITQACDSPALRRGRRLLGAAILAPCLWDINAAP